MRTSVQRGGLVVGMMGKVIPMRPVALACSVEDAFEPAESWTHVEAGLYEHPTLGEVMFETADAFPDRSPRERVRGWWWYGKRETRWPFDTATEARDNAEAWGT